jgi:Zn-dependent protease
MFQGGWLLEGIGRLVPLVLSLSVHEWAHAYAAFRLGDDTAALKGRMTVNPLAHIDPIGTFLLPLLGIPFGWAKPVPINPARFRRDISMGAGVTLSAAAGPFSNLVLAVLCAGVCGVLVRFHVISIFDGAGHLLMTTMEVNVLLCLFNLLPIPPLDGSRIIDGLLPFRYRRFWARFTSVSWLAIAIMMIFGVMLLAVPMLMLEESLQDLVRFLAG